MIVNWVSMFFFSSRGRHTRWPRDWSSDVCSSDLLTKGRKVIVLGRLHVEEWTDREGKARQSLEVNASDVQFIDSAGAGGAEGIPVRSQQGGGGAPAGGGGAARGGGGGGGGRPPADGGDIEDDEIPF